MSPRGRKGFMRRSLCRYLPVIFLIGAILLLLPWGAIGADQQTGPKMVMKEMAYDFKEVKEGDVIEHVFQVLNQGDQVLEIREVRPG
jgi:hypothetical protein